MATYRSISDLPAEVQKHVEEVMEDRRHLGDHRGRLIYMQALNLDGLSADEHSVVFSRLIAEAEAETRADIERQLAGAPRWIVEPVTEAGIAAIHAGYDGLAKIDGKAA